MILKNCITLNVLWSCWIVRYSKPKSFVNFITAFNLKISADRAKKLIKKIFNCFALGKNKKKIKRACDMKRRQHRRFPLEILFLSASEIFATSFSQLQFSQLQFSSKLQKSLVLNWIPTRLDRISGWSRCRCHMVALKSSFWNSQIFSQQMCNARAFFVCVCMQNCNIFFCSWKNKNNQKEIRETKLVRKARRKVGKVSAGNPAPQKRKYH